MEPDNDAIENVITYYKSLSQIDRELIQHYTYEIDIDDWETSPLKINYEVVNFMLKQKGNIPFDLGYIPKLLSIMTKHDIQTQIHSAKQLQYTLDTFPKSTSSFIVYKGFHHQDAYFKTSLACSQNDSFIVPYFLSTSLNLNTALRFTSRFGDQWKCVWRITVPECTPLTFIRDSYKQGTEDEVLLNLGGRYRVVDKQFNQNHNMHIVDIELLGYERSFYLRAFWQSILHTYTSS